MTTSTASRGPMGRLGDILGMIKFSHTLFALPFALLGAALASRTPDGWTIRVMDWLGILLCMVTARSAAMAFNRLVDRDIDAANPRTATRHLPAGRLRAQSVAIFTAWSAGLFVASTLCFLPRNPWPLILSVPVLGWLLGYSYAKRWTAGAHFWLGAALGFAPIAAWIAIRGSLSWPPVWLGLAVLCWVAGFDILYACQDAEFDRATGLRSVPARLGIGRALRVAAGCHALMLVMLAGLGVSYPMGLIYWAALALVAGLLAYEHRLVRPDDLSRVNAAFFHVNVAISVGLLAAGVADLVGRG